MPSNFNLDEFVRHYALAALWSSTDEHGEPLDAVFSVDDIAPETLESMREDCADFLQSNITDLHHYSALMNNGEWAGEARAGHDFWLTRNGHGAGFRDRGLGALGERLADAARVYGGVDLYAGDDGKVYA
jgi:hypothetical protein